MSFKILITDPLSDRGIEFLKKSGLEVIYKPNAEKSEVDECLEYIDGWIIRSGTTIANSFNKTSIKEKPTPIIFETK